MAEPGAFTGPEPGDHRKPSTKNTGGRRSILTQYRRAAELADKILPRDPSPPIFRSSSRPKLDLVINVMRAAGSIMCFHICPPPIEMVPPCLRAAIGISTNVSASSNC
jgi:hypothetical protein